MWIHSQTRTWHDKNVQTLGLEILKFKILNFQIFFKKKLMVFTKHLKYRRIIESIILFSFYLQDAETNK